MTASAVVSTPSWTSDGVCAPTRSTRLTLARRDALNTRLVPVTTARPPLLLAPDWHDSALAADRAPETAGEGSTSRYAAQYSSTAAGIAGGAFPTGSRASSCALNLSSPCAVSCPTPPARWSAPACRVALGVQASTAASPAATTTDGTTSAAAVAPDFRGAGWEVPLGTAPRQPPQSASTRKGCLPVPMHSLRLARL